jgi:hypothetical protein
LTVILVGSRLGRREDSRSCAGAVGGRGGGRQVEAVAGGVVLGRQPAMRRRVPRRNCQSGYGECPAGACARPARRALRGLACLRARPSAATRVSRARRAPRALEDVQKFSPVARQPRQAVREPSAERLGVALFAQPCAPSLFRESQENDGRHPPLTIDQLHLRTWCRTHELVADPCFRQHADLRGRPWPPVDAQASTGRSLQQGHIRNHLRAHLPGHRRGCRRRRSYALVSNLRHHEQSP